MTKGQLAKADPISRRLRLSKHYNPGNHGAGLAGCRREENVELTSRKLADVVVVAPAGEIDHVNAMKLEEALTPFVDAAAAAQTPLVLDFTNVEYISSMGLRMLMAAARRMRSRNAPMAVAGLQQTVQEIFEIARFRFVVDVFPSVRDALVALSVPAVAAYDASPT
jgi:anti-sigma B factor antagonist/stage II sporulation protein AA (anti-sigma F factor antagonist)